MSWFMLRTMILDLQESSRGLGAYDMITRLKDMFQELIVQERFETMKALLGWKLEEEECLHDYIFEIKSYTFNGFVRWILPNSVELEIDISLNSLTSSYDEFV